MISTQFPSLELSSYGVNLPGRNDTRLVMPKCLNRQGQEEFKRRGYDLDKEVSIFQPDPPPSPPDDTLTVEQR